MAEAMVSGLVGSLLNVVADPKRVDVLYGLLREHCHKFRNDLNSIQLSLYLARKAGAEPGSKRWDDVEEQYRGVERLIDNIQEICRPMAIRPIRYPLDALMEERGAVWSEWMADAGRRLELDRPSSPAVGWFDPTRLVRSLDALAAWRARDGEAGTTVRLAWSEARHEFRVDWIEPGVSTLEGTRASAGRPISLALPLVARMVTAHGGSLDISGQDELRFTLRWPSEIEPGDAGFA